MKFITIDASKSLNPNTGESWYRAETKVSVDDGEVPEEVFQALKKRLDSWLPNPFETTGSNRSNVVPDEKTDQEFEDLKAKLAGMEFYEDAKEYLDSTDFKHTMEAKIIINSKKRKV